jgi:hypothetical protein
MPRNDSNAPLGAADTRSLSKIKVAGYLLLARCADCCGEYAVAVDHALSVFHQLLPCVARGLHLPTERGRHIYLSDNNGRIGVGFDHPGVIFVACSFLDRLSMELECLSIATTVTAAEPVAQQLARGFASYFRLPVAH